MSWNMKIVIPSLEAPELLKMMRKEATTIQSSWLNAVKSRFSDLQSFDLILLHTIKSKFDDGVFSLPEIGMKFDELKTSTFNDVDFQTKLFTSFDVKPFPVWVNLLDDVVTRIVHSENDLTQFVLMKFTSDETFASLEHMNAFPLLSSARKRHGDSFEFQKIEYIIAIEKEFVVIDHRFIDIFTMMCFTDRPISRIESPGKPVQEGDGSNIIRSKYFPVENGNITTNVQIGGKMKVPRTHAVTSISKKRKKKPCIHCKNKSECDLDKEICHALEIDDAHTICPGCARLATTTTTENEHWRFGNFEMLKESYGTKIPATLKKMKQQYVSKNFRVYKGDYFPYQHFENGPKFIDRVIAVDSSSE